MPEGELKMGCLMALPKFVLNLILRAWSWVVVHRLSVEESEEGWRIINEEGDDDVYIP
jgi:hypothetical protein